MDAIQWFYTVHRIDHTTPILKINIDVLQI